MRTPEKLVHGCWLGKSIGGTLGLPAEGRMERLDFTFYDPIPTIAPPNDDLELQLVWLEMVEKAGNLLTRAHFAQAWLDHIHYMWDEYGRVRWNLRRSVPLESVGTFENDFVSGMGSPIRSEFWACLFPNDIESAAHYAALDASLDHGTEGIAGEVLFAVMQAAILSGESLEQAIIAAFSFIPSECETARAIALVRHCHREKLKAWDCWQKLLAQFGSENFTHAPLNVALTLWALLYGNQDFEKSVLLAVNGGYDTDCTAATVGATLGLLLGTGGIPERWIAPIGEGIYVGSGILGINAPKTLAELTERTLALTGKLQPRKWSNSFWQISPAAPRLEDLPGTIVLHPFAGKPVPWANGELPQAVCRAGGATWEWEVSHNEERQIICLARQGARLFVDDKLVCDCPAGLPFVPATHRSPSGSRYSIRPGKGTHSVRLELGGAKQDQQATLILAYPNFHIAPWTSAELPNPAVLPPASAI